MLLLYMHYMTVVHWTIEGIISLSCRRVVLPSSRRLPNGFDIIVGRLRIRLYDNSGSLFITTFCCRHPGQRDVSYGLIPLLIPLQAVGAD